MKKLQCFFTALAMLFTALAYGQNIVVTGVVTDAVNNEPVPFASLQLKGTSTGASADADGNYSISVPSDGVLVFSSLGYHVAEVPVDGKKVINVTLHPDSEFLDETIVIAYGTATKSSFTGSASVVKSETISSHVSSTVTSSLAGTTPGVQVISSTGDPASGGSSTIRIRGVGSMYASNSPLIILDGMPYEGAMSDVNPNDVESISVLKDASASAIYGARGANGVVLITTKKSAGRDAVVKFDARWGSNSRLIPQYDVITDPGEYYETHYRMMFNSQKYAGKTDAEAYAYADKYLFDQNNGGLGYMVYTVDPGQKLIGTNFKLNPNARLGYSDGEYTYLPDDWYNETFHNSFRHEYNVSVSGGSNRFSYYASAGFLDDKGIVSNSEYKRYTARVNADYQAKSWLKFLTNLSYSYSDSQIPQYDSGYGGSGNIFYVCNMMAPIYPLYVRDADGNIMYENGRRVYDSSDNTNFKRAGIIGNAVRDNDYNKQQNYADVLTGKFGVVATPVKGLSLSANVGLMSDNTRYNSLSSRFGSASSIDGSAYVLHTRYFTVNQQYIAEYKTDFNGSNHNFDILAGYEQFNVTYQYFDGSNDHLFNPYIGELGNADGSDNKYLSSYTTRYMTMGVLARLQYDYAGKYFVSASYRRDASSRFAKGHRWGDFGSVGVAWLISQENFMSNASWVNMLKLKVSYGLQGNDNLQSYFPYADTYTHSYNSETKEYSLNLSYKGNEDLTWESSHSFNVGLDFELFGGYLDGSVEFFDRITSDMLYYKDVPLSSGNPTGYMPVNVGSVDNVGVELTLGGNIIRNKNVQWNWNLNLSHYKNTILSLDESVSENGIKSYNYIYKVGGSLYQAYMRKYAGVDKETGKALWYYEKEITDENDNVIGYETDVTDVFSKSSQYDCGTVMPKVYGGFGTSLNAYGFDFSIQLAFQLGGKYYDGTYQALMHTDTAVGSAWHKDVLKSWSETNRNSNIPRLDGDTSVGQTACDIFLISSNYLSVNNVTLGYSFPAKWMEKLKIAGLRLYVSGENLAVLTARKGMDPRYSMGLGSYTSGSGLNSGSYSAVRNITGGLTFTF